MFVALLLSASGVIAEPSEAPAGGSANSEIPVSLELSGPPGCGSLADLAARVRWRTTRVRFVPATGSERALRVELASEDNATVATLYVTEPNGRRSTRTLRAKSCDQAVDAAALVLAVTLDPLASTAPTPENVTSGDGGTSDAPDAGTLPAPDATSEPLDEPPSPGDPSSGGGTSAVTLVPSIGLVGQMQHQPAPGLLFGLGIVLGLGWERDSPFSPALRVTASRYFPRGFAYDAGTATFDVWSATVDLCPFELELGHEALTVHPCGSFTFGRVEAAGTDTLEAREAATEWWVAGGTALFQWRPIEPLMVALSGAVGQPLVLDAFNFEPDPAFHHVSSPTWTLGLGAGVFFR